MAWNCPKPLISFGKVGRLPDPGLFDLAHWTPESGRRVIRPNEGFMHQLGLFEQCKYMPAETHSVYIKWKEDCWVCDCLSALHVRRYVNGPR
jgi:hypothetical protein